MGIVSAGLSLLSVIIAVAGIKYAISHTRKLRGELTTKYVGNFPGHLPMLVEFIGQVDKSVSILADSSAYGSFSSPQIAAEYRAALQRARELNLKVSMIVADPEYQQDLDRTQVEQLSKDEQKRLTTFTSFEKLPSEATLDSIMNILNKKDYLLMDHLVGDVWILPRKQPPVIHCWIFDNLRAIFSIPSQMTIHEQAFYTEDSKLVEALRGIHDKAMAAATEYVPEQSKGL